MRNALIHLPLLLAAVAGAKPADNLISPFFDASIADALFDGNDTAVAIELVKRQSGCASGYSNCAGIGAPGSCCKSNSQVCSADSSGHVGCCPVGAACTGTIAGATAGQSVVTTGITTTTGTATTTGGFIIGTGTSSSAAITSRSTVPNPYYPFPYIATTYTNAAACSAAYTGCQTDFASCTSALGGSVNGVTVDAPNGAGITVQAITATLPSAQASSACSSLSSVACYNLQVEACQAFGTGSGSAATGAAARAGCRSYVYGMGAGVAVGMAGQML